MTLPDRIGIDANGYGWRAWDDLTLDDKPVYSMVPQNPDNSPIPEPVTWYIPVGTVEPSAEWASLCRAAAALGAAFAEFENARDEYVRAVSRRDGTGTGGPS